jgi:predicted ATP-dependent protease
VVIEYYQNNLTFDHNLTLQPLARRGRVGTVGSVAMKAQAAAKEGAATIVCPPENVSDVPKDLSLSIVGVSSLEDLLACALALPENCRRSLEDKANAKGTT